MESRVQFWTGSCKPVMEGKWVDIQVWNLGKRLELK